MAQAGWNHDALLYKTHYHTPGFQKVALVSGNSHHVLCFHRLYCVDFEDMAHDSILTYLPSGWTEEKYKNATDGDWEELSEEVRPIHDKIYFLSYYVFLC